MAINSGKEDKDDVMKPVREKRFTLTELLVGTAILLIMMTMLAQILGTLTKGWSLARSNARIYERAQLVFDMMGRDFQTAIAGKQGGKDIYIVWGDTSVVNTVPLTGSSRVFSSNGGANTVQFHMISLMNENVGEAPGEIHYCYDPDPTKQTIYRAIAKQYKNPTDTITNADWDFLSKSNLTNPTDAAAPTLGGWHATPILGSTDYYPLIDGVTDFRIKVSPHNAGELPDAVMVSVTLMDTEGAEAVKNNPTLLAKRIKASQRCFTKVFFLGRDRRLGEPKTN
jgi:type II secretory pathway pseudopilin PulG